MYKYTVCLIMKENQLLLLNRKKKPAMGMWHGVGGKIEENETPVEGVLRETFEETGIRLKDVSYAGNAVLNSKDGSEGMYIFVAHLPDDVHVQTPLNTDEGILDWRTTDWILDKDNMGVIGNLKSYLPSILKAEYGLEHTFIYDAHTILDYTTSKIMKNEISTRYKKSLLV
ncbi:MAG TPA: 8-oxo-dGTP diphosphatase [Bacillales bacterium]|nr:8-oxo-dGTP diphosphatase [Bacillales bacterium]